MFYFVHTSSVAATSRPDEGRVTFLIVLSFVQRTTFGHLSVALVGPLCEAGAFSVLGTSMSLSLHARSQL
jgi:hypothetical protein